MSTLFRAQMVFAILVLTAYSVLRTQWGSEHLLEPMNEHTAQVSALALSVVCPEAYSNGTQVVSESGSVSIREGCNGVHAMLAFIAAVAACPSGWWRRLLGVLFLSAAVFALNVIRVVSLLYILRVCPSAFPQTHDYLWQFAIIVIGSLLWLVWYEKLGRKSTDRTNS